MGETVTANNNRPPEPPKRSTVPAGTPAAGPAPGKSTRGNSAPAAPGTGNTPAAGSGNGTAAAGKAQEKAQPVGLAAVTPPPVPDAPKKKQRKPRQKKQEQPTSFNASQLSALIVSLSSIVASRPGLDMFVISELEAQQIATPLANMIAKNESLNGLSEHADAIALVTACFVIMAPRIMLYFDAQKERKKLASGGVRLVRTNSQNAKSNENGGKSAGHSTPAPENDVHGFFAAMPPIAD